MPAQFNSLITLSMVVPIVLSVVVTVIVLVWVRKFMRNMTGANLKNGTPAQATILRIWDTGTTINDNPVVGFLLEVRPQNLPAYQAESKSMIPRLSIPQFQPGATVPVKIDPLNQSRVALDIFA
ncbi:MAG TPA: hypothetical protein VFU22_17040 [Roseiflexaceae bacterium]|nr:hypothetical protein [Roseiflexaceae bacterium]